MHDWQGVMNRLTLDLSRAMTICFVSLCSGIVLAGCAITEQHPQSAPSNERKEATPPPQTSTLSFPALSEEDIKRLNERFPTRQMEVLKNAEQIEVFEVVSTDRRLCGIESELKPIKKDKFQGCEIVRQASVSDPQQRKELIDGILYSIGSSSNGSACFDPRHGIRAIHNKERIELLICFECMNFRGSPELGSEPVRNFAGDYVGGNKERFGGGFSPSIEPLFEKILSKADK
ncbi:MAG: hypothetical protein KF685_12105 [Acidobacteria bacterium]|nr:hypothetical protein [Acidobacteriota bacterium]